jgi:hypothetical protein
MRGATGLVSLTEIPNVAGDWWRSDKLSLDVGTIGPGYEAPVIEGELQIHSVQGLLGCDNDIFEDNESCIRGT